MKQSLRSLLMPIGASVFALIIGWILSAALGYNPWLVMQGLFVGAFGNAANIGNTLAIASPLILVGLGIALAFRAGLFNIGAEGQFWIGATAAAYVGYHFTTMNAFLHIVLCLLAAMVAGGLWAGVIPGLAKAFRGAHEVISTMMMSYIAILLGKYLIDQGGPMRDPHGYVSQSPQIASNIQLPTIIYESTLTGAIFIALAASVVAWWVLFHTTLGYKLRTVGFNHRAAKYAGMNVAMYTVLALGLSGVFAGLAGGLQVLGSDYRLMDGFNTGYGFTAIVVALLARNNPFGVIFAAIFFAALETGGGYMQQISGVQASLTSVLEGLIIFFVAIERVLPMLRDWYRRRRNRGNTTQISREGHKPA